MAMRPRAYEGKEPYIFVSYAHKDDDQVFEILSALGEKGYRVWYDEGITPGSEWTEDIARHLDDSAMVIAFITPASMASKNCRREINYALFKEKPFLSVILEKTEMSPGMTMQLSVQQSILRYDYTSWESFIDKILRCPEIAPCKIPEPVKKPSEESDKETVTEAPGAVDPVSKTEHAADESAMIMPTGPKEIAPVNSRKAEVPAKTDTVLKVHPVEPEGLKTQKTKKKLPLIPILLGIACIVLVVFAVTILGGVKTSWGEKIKSNTETVSVSKKKLTQSDLSGIAGLKNLKFLYLSDSDFSDCDFSNVEFASNGLTKVSIENCTGINDFSFLKGKQLENLTLNGCDSFSDLSLLDLSSLYILLLDGTGVTDLSALKGTKIFHLSFQDTAVSDISFAAEMPSLQEICGTGSKVASLAPLENLENLERIEFRSCPISELPQSLESLRLKYVDLSRCGLTDIGFLGNCTLIKTLYLNDNPSLQELGELPENNKGALINLSLSRTGIEAQTLQALAPCTQLKTLFVSGIPLEDLSFVSGMVNLSSLTAENCGITDISALSGLKNLEIVRLAFNNIEDITPLEGSMDHSGLQTVDLSFNRLTSAESLPEERFGIILLHGNDSRIGATLREGVKAGLISLPWDDSLLDRGKDINDGIYLVDCPKAKQVKAEGIYPYCHFVTEQELMKGLYDGSISYYERLNYDYPYEVYQSR